MWWWNGWILQAVHYHHLLVCIEKEVHGSADVSVFRFLQELSQSAWFTSLSRCPTAPKQEILSSTRPASKPHLWESITSHFYTQSIINMSEQSVHVEIIWHDISHKQAEKIQCAESQLIDLFKISEKPYTARFKEESFRGTDELVSACGSSSKKNLEIQCQKHLLLLLIVTHKGSTNELSMKPSNNYLCKNVFNLI